MEHLAVEHNRAPVIRRYREKDLGAVYDICVRTADGGADARGKYRSDDLMPDLFAGPYVFLEPGRGRGVHVTVVADNVRAIGFYRRLGFAPLEVADPGAVVYLGRTL